MFAGDGGDAGDFEGGSRLRETERHVAVPIAIEPTAAPDPTKPKAGWGNDSAASTPKTTTESAVATFTDDGAASARRRRPEDDEDEALVQEVAAPPTVESKPIVSVRELERATQFALPQTPDPGVDLSVLSSALRPPGHVAEEMEETWHPDSLFSKLIGELLTEQEDEEQRREAREAQEAESLRRGAIPPAVVVSASFGGSGTTASV